MARRRKLRLRGVLLILALLVIASYAYWFFGAGSMVPPRDADSGQVYSARGINVLIVGNDKNIELGLPGRADTIIVAHVEPKEKSLFFLSLPRDTLVEIDGYGQDKLNHAFAYGGVDLLRNTVEDYLNIPIDYYAVTDFNGFQQIVDVLGGVDIEVDKRMYYQTYDGLIDIEAGLQHLDGERALQYVRYRQDELGDITRVGRQQKFLKALIDECSDWTIIPKLPQLLLEVNKMVETDLPTRYILRLGLSLRTLGADALESDTLPGDFATINGVSYWRGDEGEITELVAEEFGEPAHEQR